MNAVSTAVDPLPPAVDDVLRRYWGFEALRPLQGSAIHAVLERRDSVVVLPTGGGKSLCFQVPALIGDDPGVALVVSPLIALMKDQVDGLVASGVPAARLDSTMSSDARQATFNGLRDGRFKLLYVSPERLMGDGGAGFQATMARTGVRYIAIDEAHCISHWATTSGRSTGNWARCARRGRRCRCTPSRRPRPPVYARTSCASSGCATRWCWSAASIGRT